MKKNAPPARRGPKNIAEMKTIQDELNELRAILQGDAADKEQLYQEKFDYIQANYTTESDQEAIGNFILDSYKEMNEEADELLQQTEKAKELRKMKEIIPVSYIARHYFGKSAAWLQQRLYGYKVRGRVYTLSKEDRRKFDDALQDIANQIRSFSIA